MYQSRAEQSRAEQSRAMRIAFIALALATQVFIQTEAHAEPLFLHMGDNNQGYIDLDDLIDEGDLTNVSLSDNNNGTGLAEGQIIEFIDVVDGSFQAVTGVRLDADLTFETPFGNLPWLNDDNEPYLYIGLLYGAITADSANLIYFAEYAELDLLNRMVFAPHWGDQNLICVYPPGGEDSCTQDLSSGAEAEVRVAMIGDGGERQLVVEFRNFTGSTQTVVLPTDDDGELLDSFITFQVVFNESSSELPPVVYYNYPDATAPYAPRSSLYGTGRDEMQISAQYDTLDDGIDDEVIVSDFTFNPESTTNSLYELTDGTSLALIDCISIEEDLSYSGFARSGMPATFEFDASEYCTDFGVEYDLNLVVEVDLDDGNGYQDYGYLPLSLSHTYDQADDYEITARVSAVNPGSSNSEVIGSTYLYSQTIDLAIEEFTDDELLTIVDFLIADDSLEDYGLFSQSDLDDAIADTIAAVQASPGDYELFSQSDLDDAIADTIAAVQASPRGYELFSQSDLDDAKADTIAAVQASPGDYELFSQSDLDTEIDDAQSEIIDDPESFGLVGIMNTPEDIDALDEGISLLSTSVEIDDLDEYFSSARLVWIYEDDAFRGWSPDEATRERIQSSGYNLIRDIQAGEGFWVYK